jgi:hypothetical protein
MCAMIAITVKITKLVMKMLWNSLASDSVSPDRERPVLGASTMCGTSYVGLSADCRPKNRGGVEMPSRRRHGHACGEPHVFARHIPMKDDVAQMDAMVLASPKIDMPDDGLFLIKRPSRLIAAAGSMATKQTTKIRRNSNEGLDER